MNEDIQKALEVLMKGGVILYPTDTVWGLGCDATNEAAVKRIYEIKQRDDSKSMLVLMDDAGRVASYVRDMPSIAYDLMEANDQPMTLIYPGAKNLAKNLIAEDGSIGIRVATDEFCRKLLYRFRKPIVSSSANISDSPSPANFGEISAEIKTAVDYVVKWRQNDSNKRKPSSIIKLGPKGEVEIIRK
jgi:L-threonylcarbamoyladenylate synthase